MSSDVCKHCTHAACLDVCPTGSLFRTEFGTVVVQEDICNGCGYCVPACPYGVIERRKGPTGAKNVGIAQKCTLCYDRLGAGETPACAQACPTQSIQFGDVEELRERANQRVEKLHEAGIMDARLYGNDPDDGVGGTGAFFLLLDKPGLRLPARPRGDDQGPARMFAHAGVRGRHAAGRRSDLVPREAEMSSSDIDATPGSAGSRRRRGGRRRKGGGAGDRSMVPEATFTSYYGRAIVKPSPWEADIPAYLFAGGLAAGSSLLAAGADLTGRAALRRSGAWARSAR